VSCVVFSGKVLFRSPPNGRAIANLQELGMRSLEELSPRSTPVACRRPPLSSNGWAGWRLQLAPPAWRFWVLCPCQVSGEASPQALRELGARERIDGADGYWAVSLRAVSFRRDALLLQIVWHMAGPLPGFVAPRTPLNAHSLDLQRQAYGGAEL